jgi:cytochrome c-type biogenesis protein CcmH
MVGMSGLLLCATMAVAAAILLCIAGGRGRALLLAYGALAAGCAAFAIVRRDGTTTQQVASKSAPQSLTSERQAFTGQFTAGENWLRMSDALAARGNTADAAGVLIAAVREHPRDYSLWVGLGNMLTEHGGGLNPGARLAYRRARELAPDYPAPRYFLGVAEARSGNIAEARRLWTAMLADAPADASWRPLVEDRLAQSAPAGPSPR